MPCRVHWRRERSRRVDLSGRYPGGKIDGARDLVGILTEETLTPAQYRAVGRLVRQLHDAGVCHTDLNIHNILLDNEGQFWLIDFDKCGRRDGDSWKAANLSRLQRSFNKEVGRFQIRWQPADWDALMQGYQLIKRT